MIKFYGFILLVSILLSSPLFCTSALDEHEQHQKQNILNVRVSLDEHKVFYIRYSIEQKKIIGVQHSLAEEIKTFQANIKKCYQEANFEELLEIHKEFRRLQGLESEWQDVARRINTYRWPQQDWRQTVTGHLFFPHHIYKLMEAPVTEYLMERKDTLWGLAISAYDQNPLGQYYLFKTLNRLRGSFFDEKRPDFLNQLYQNSLTAFSQYLADDTRCSYDPTASSVKNEVCYAFGNSKLQYPYLGDNYSSQSASDVFSQGTDFKNKIEDILCQHVSLRPDLYEKLGDQGYGSAYRERANDPAVKTPEKIDLLKKAIHAGDNASYIYLGDIYKADKNNKDAHDCYLKAVERGIPYGYIECGIYFIGDILLDPQAKAQKFPENYDRIIQQASKFFKLAGKKKDPKGWLYLAALAKKCYELEPTAIKYQKKRFRALIRAMKLGSSEAYTMMGRALDIAINSSRRHDELYPFEETTTYQQLIKRYGDSPAEDFYIEIQDYWKTLD